MIRPCTLVFCLVTSLHLFALQLSVLPVWSQEPEAPLARAAGNEPDKSAFPTWQKLETEAYRGKQDDIFFVTPEIGWYVNGAGRIYKTSDGGKNWKLQLDKPGTYFRCIAFLDEQHGFAGNIGPGYFPNVTDPTPLYETIDGGETWASVKSIDGPPIVGLCAIQVLKEPIVNAGHLDTRTTLYAVGRVGGPVAMLVSEDMGKSWQQRSLSQSASMAMDVYFFNRNEGVVAAASHADVAQSHATILTTADGGATWTQAYQSERPYELTWKIAFPSPHVGYVTIQSYNPDPTVQQRYVAKTTNGGKTWTELPLVKDSKVREFGVGFLNESVGWVGAMPGGYQTIDGGTSWTPVAMGNAVNKIRVLPTDQGYSAFAIGTQVHRIDVPKKAIPDQESPQASQDMSDEARILARLQEQVNAWNAGNIALFMDTYWKSEQLTFSSGGTVTRGWQATLDRYKNRYSTRAKMGTLSFDQLEVIPISKDVSLTLGRWKLQREDDAPSGSFSLVLHRIDGKWFIVHDHTSSDVKP